MWCPHLFGNGGRAGGASPTHKPLVPAAPTLSPPPISFLVMWALGCPQVKARDGGGAPSPMCWPFKPPGSHHGPSTQVSVPEGRRGCAPSSVGLQGPWALCRIFTEPWWEGLASTMCSSWILAPPAPREGGKSRYRPGSEAGGEGARSTLQLPQAGRWVYRLLGPPQTKLLSWVPAPPRPQAP